MTQDKETLREADKVAALTDFQLRVVALPVHEKPMALAFEAGWDAAIATMFERLRTPSEGMQDAGYDCLWDEDHRLPRESMNSIWQAMLAAFQQENSDAV